MTVSLSVSRLVFLRAACSAADATDPPWAPARDIRGCVSREASVLVVARQLSDLHELGMLRRVHRHGVWWYQPTAEGRRMAAQADLPVASVQDAIRRFAAS